MGDAGRNGVEEPPAAPARAALARRTQHDWRTIKADFLRGDWPDLVAYASSKGLNYPVLKNRSDRDGLKPGGKTWPAERDEIRCVAEQIVRDEKARSLAKKIEEEDERTAKSAGAVVASAGNLIVKLGNAAKTMSDAEFLVLAVPPAKGILGVHRDAADAIARADRARRIARGQLVEPEVSVNASAAAAVAVRIDLGGFTGPVVQANHLPRPEDYASEIAELEAPP